MRLFLSALAVLVLVCASHQTTDHLLANDVVDGLLSRFSKNMKIPSLPTLKESGEVKVLYWKTEVDIQADGGAAVGNVSLKRFGDATLFFDSYGNPLLDVEVGVDGAEISYNYKSEVAGISGPSGRFIAKVGASSVNLTIVMFPADTHCRLALDRNQIGRLGEITVEHGGSNTVNAIYHELLVEMLTDERKTYLETYLKEAWNMYWYCSSLQPQVSGSRLTKAAGEMRRGPAHSGPTPVRRFQLQQ